MTAPDRDALEQLLAEADQHGRAGRFADALAAAERAQQGAMALGDLGLEVRALSLVAAARRMAGERAEAMARYERIMALAQPARRAEAARAGVTRHVVKAHMNWVECGRALGQRAIAELAGALDAGDAYLRDAGKPEWRGGLLSLRASLLEAQGRHEEALPAAEEALALAETHPDAPSYPPAVHRRQRADLLRRLGRVEEAREGYRAVLADPGASAHARLAAETGAGYCALALGDADDAARAAAAAVALAERLGDDARCAALELATRAGRARGDLVAAGAAATREVEAARRTGSPERMYFALRDVLDVALDAQDAEAARPLLGEVDALAAALDGARGGETFRAEAKARRDEFEALTGEGPRRPRRLRR